MQKVVGSNPIIRSEKPAGNGGFFASRPRTGNRRGPDSQLRVSFRGHGETSSEAIFCEVRAGRRFDLGRARGGEAFVTSKDSTPPPASGD
jgi:hypothetical protein